MGVDPLDGMKHLGIFLASLFALLAPALGQQRAATVRLADGRTLEGRVVAMSLESLDLQVGDVVVQLPAVDIRSCQFRELGEVEVAADIDKATDGRGESANVASAAGQTGERGQGRPAPMRLQTIPDYVVPGSDEALPLDLRHVPRWKLRLQILDEAYPWLAPAAATQWFSLGLLLLIGLGLSVHLSVQVVGAEAAPLHRSVALGAWYLVTGIAQVAMVPIHDFSIVLMLLGNTSLALFALHALYGLTRWWAVVALMVQLGCAVIAFGVLELVDAVLGSVGAAA